MKLFYFVTKHGDIVKGRKTGKKIGEKIEIKKSDGTYHYAFEGQLKEVNR